MKRNHFSKKILGFAAAVIMASSSVFGAFAEEGGPGVQGADAPKEEFFYENGEELVDSTGMPYVKYRINFGNIYAEYEYVEGDKLRNVRYSLNGVDGTIVYRTHCYNGEGTLPRDWVMNGVVNGVELGAHHVEAVQINLAQTAGYFYDVWYRVVMKHAGELGWAKNGEKAGYPGVGDYVTNIEVALLPKGSAAPGETSNSFRASFHENFERNEQGFFYRHPEQELFTGWLDDGKNRYYVYENNVLVGWHYIDGLKYYFQEDGTLLMNVDAVIGKQPNYLIKINKQTNCLTVYAQDGANGYIIPVKSMLTSVGDDTPIGTFKSPEKYRWRQMVTGAYSQYATRVKAGAGYLIHSVIYDVPDNRTLWTGTYNELGVARSLGCIRLTTENAKWIYDNCAIGTTINIYNDPVPGPFYKPEIIPIPHAQFWDPTDPEITF